MKLKNEYSSKDLFGKLPKILLFIFLAACANTIRAQSINDDLQPAKTTGKSGATTAPTPRGKNQRQTKSRQPSKKTAATPVNVAPVTPQPSTAQPPPQPQQTQQQQVVVPAQPATPLATPSEIIERFMNFQQSQNVTGKDWENVVKQATASLQENPDDKTVKAQLAFARGELAFNRNDYSNALIQFNAAAQLLSDSALPFYGIGRVYLNTKQPVQAQNAFERAAKIDKNFALAYKGLGDSMTALGKTKKADDYYKQAARVGIARDSSAGNAGNNSANQGASTVGVSATMPAQSESSYDRELKIAREYTSSKKWQLSIDKLMPLAASNPSAEIYIAIGDNYYGMEAWLSAQQAYRKATELNPNLALAYYKSGMVLYETNEFQAAGEAFEKSLILDQSGASINRAQARKWADKANEKVRDMNKSGKKKGLSKLWFN